MIPHQTLAKLIHPKVNPPHASLMSVECEKQLFKIGTRGSALALWQAHEIKRRLEEVHSGLTVELVIFKTRGDHILDRPLSEEILRLSRLVQENHQE